MNISKNRIEDYYKKQSIIYDITRPYFLFGRKEIVDRIASKSTKGNLLEIGCGTGYLLKEISKKTDLELTGIDLSVEMLSIAKKKLSVDVELIHSDIIDYESQKKYDSIILSYVFTLDLVNAGSQIEKIKSLLKPNGNIYVVDFHKYGTNVYKKYMNWHGIEMSEGLLELLESNFNPTRKIIKNAYGGVWEYFLFEGQNVSD